jgi:hypothetical protein
LSAQFHGEPVSLYRGVPARPRPGKLP